MKSGGFAAGERVCCYVECDRTQVMGELGFVAVADEGGAAVDGLDAIVVGGVAVDDACEVAEFVEDGG